MFFASIDFYYPKKIRESIDIYKREDNFNTYDNTALSKGCGPVFQKLKKSQAGTLAYVQSVGVYVATANFSEGIAGLGPGML